MAHGTRIFEGNKARRAKPTVLVVGGNGGMLARYREVVERQGYELLYYEKKVPPGMRHVADRVALVVIMVCMISHALKEQARSVTPAGVSVVYLKTSSVSALQNAVQQWAALDPMDA